MIRLALALLSALLPDDDWSEEFLESLKEEAAKIASRRGRTIAGLWALLQLARPSTLLFVLRMRRRRGALSAATWPATDLLLDLRYAARSLRRDPKVTIFVGLTLAIGIGGVTALYGVADRLFLSGPPHVADADEVVRVYLEVPDPSGTRTSPWIPWATGRAVQERVGSFAGVTLHRWEEVLVRTGDATRPAPVSFTDPAYFDVLGTDLVAGRAYRPDDRASGDAVAVVSAAFVNERFGRIEPRDALGRTLELSDRTLTIVGVAPAAFAGGGLQRIDVWTPLDESAAGSRNWWVTARLAPGTRAETARAEAQSVHARQDPGRFFQWAREGEIRVGGLDRDFEGNRTMERAVALLLLSVVALVLVVAWVNVLNLLLARLTRRRGELGVRVALGIGRLRMARQLLLETALLGGVGVGLALPVAWAAGHLVRSVLLPDVPWASLALGAEDIAVAGALGAATALLLGALVFPSAIRPDSHGILRARVGTATPSALRLQRGLATAQVALSTVLLLSAGLFVRSFLTMKGTDLGVDAEEVYAVDLRSLEAEGWSRGEADPVQRMALERLRGTDPTTRWALAIGLPFVSGFSMSIHVPGLDSIPVLPGGGPFIVMVSDGYFETVGTRILRGRAPSSDAAETGAREIVVGASTADALWPGGDPLGGCVRIGGAEDPCWTVVGVAEDTHRQGYREPPSLQIYGPLGVTDRFRGATLLARPAGQRLLADAVRDQIVALDPRVDFVEVRRIDTFLAAEIRPWRLAATMLSLAAGLAIAIALAGVLAVLSYLVEQRRREVGVRLALGASRNSIRRLLLGVGLRIGILGAAIGLTTALLVSRWIAPLLFETRVLDVGLMLLVAATVTATGALACLVPARTAARIDPMETLRAGE